MLHLLHRINCSQACGPFVNYTTSWDVLPTAVSHLPHGVQTLLYALSSEAFAVSFFVVTWYVCLCGALMLDPELFLSVTEMFFRLCPAVWPCFMLSH